MTEENGNKPGGMLSTEGRMKKMDNHKRLTPVVMTIDQGGRSFCQLGLKNDKSQKEFQSFSHLLIVLSKSVSDLECRYPFFIPILSSFFSICSCGTATPPQNQMLCMWREARPPSNLYTGQLSTMCDLGSSTDTQGVVNVTQLMKTGCTSASAWAETVQNAPLPSGQVGTRHGNSGVIDDLGVGWRISLPSSSPNWFHFWIHYWGSIANRELRNALRHWSDDLVHESKVWLIGWHVDHSLSTFIHSDAWVEDQ